LKTIFSEEGDIRSVDVLAALVALWREGASGAIHFSRSGATAGFQLSAGELTAVTSSDARYETAAILMRAGKLEAANIDRLVTPQGGDRALAALHAGILTKREWRWGEKIRAVEVLSDLLTWIEGDYVFDRGSHAEAGEFRLTVPRLILELFLRSRDRGLILHYLGGADVPLARGPHFEAEFAAFGLTADAEAVVRLIDGKATAAHIASEGPAEPFAVEKLLAALVTLGLVYPEFVAPEGAPKGAPESAQRGVLEGPGPQREAPPPAAKHADPSAPERPAPVPAEPLTAETEVSEEAVEEFEEEETGEHSARFHELDVPPPPEPAEPDIDEELDGELDGELDQAEASAEEIPESAVGDYEIAEPGASAAEPVPSPDAEPSLEYEPEDAPREAIGGGEASALAGPTSLEPETKSRLPLDYATGVGSVERPAARSGARWLWILVLLAAGVGAVILLRGRASAPPTRVAATRESPTPAPVPTEETPALSATAPPTPIAPGVPAAGQGRAASSGVAATTIVAPRTAPTVAAKAAPSVVAKAAPTVVAKAAPTVVAKAAPTVVAKAAPTVLPRVTAKPAATPRAVPSQPAPAPSAAPSTETAGTSRQTWLDRAARDHQKASADRRNHFTIQLELACETQTLVDAWKHDRPAGTMWLLTSTYEGKTCFRVLWGRYPSKEAARRALAGIPSFFSSNHNRPVITAIR
jgi:Meckel syndrome type 1 protein